MDYAEEQRSELDALAAIYADEYELTDEGPPAKFVMHAASADVESPLHMAADIFFTFPPKYPEEPPELRIQPVRDMNADHAAELLSHLQSLALSSLGMGMVYTLVEAAKEWLTDHSSSMHDKMVQREMAERIRQHDVEEEQGLDEEERQRRAAAAEAARLEQERLERLRLGTPVTRENFLKWKLKFDAEREAERAKTVKVVVKKLTGRQLFEGDSSLAESDMTYVDTADAAAAAAAEDAAAAAAAAADEGFDESLFEAEDPDALDIPDA